jgi:hypothetical protein
MAGFDGRTVRSANAAVPFLARFTGQGVTPGDGNPSIVRFKVPWPVPHPFDALSVTVNVPGLVGMPKMSPVIGFTNKPWGSVSGPKLVGLWFVFGDWRKNGTPVCPDAFVFCGVKPGT